MSDKPLGPPLREDITLSTGKVITHRRMSNGAQAAEALDAAGVDRGMSEEEAAEYHRIVNRAHERTIAYAIVDRGTLIAWEWTVDGDTYFYAVDQSFWAGVRCGSFPGPSDRGKKLDRELVGLQSLSDQVRDAIVSTHKEATHNDL